MNDGEAGRGNKEKLEPRQVDAYWLQRELNKLYQDPIVSQKKVNEVMDILKVRIIVFLMVFFFTSVLPPRMPVMIEIVRTSLFCC